MPEIIDDRLQLILDSILLIDKRMTKIKTPHDFYKEEDNMETLDGVSMRLQHIGENVKKISEINNSFFNETLSYDVEPIIRFRDFISHHYEKTDAEIIFDICKNYLPELKSKIMGYIKP